MSNGIIITDEMRKRAEEEAKKRNPHIHHHFEVSHFTSLERDIIGFLGEFCACEMLGIDWRRNIRENYIDIDNGDGVCKKGIFDVKTETVPRKNAGKILNYSIGDNELYGRRLINKGQVSLLQKYNIVIFGLIIREEQDKWYPIGWLETDYILNNYSVTYLRPDGGNYPFPALPIKTSDLKPIEQLIFTR